MSRGSGVEGGATAGGRLGTAGMGGLQGVGPCGHDSAMHICGEDGGNSSSSSSGGEGGGGPGDGGVIKKRKSFDFNLVSEKMKRCRIAGIPGEIRLRKDIQDCADLGDVSFLDNVRLLQTAEPLTIHVQFEAKPPHMPSAPPPPPPNRPSFFTIRVPKFYPHQPPVVTVPDVNFSGRAPFVAVDGKVTHPLLGEGWRAVSCMKDVIRILCSIRECESEQQLMMALQHEGHLQHVVPAGGGVGGVEEEEEEMLGGSQGGECMSY